MTMRYELIIYWSKEDESFVVEVPELPGCMADGQTYAEAVANAEEVRRYEDHATQSAVDDAQQHIGGRPAALGARSRAVSRRYFS